VNRNVLYTTVKTYTRSSLYSMKAYGGVDVCIHIFLTSALAGGEWSASRPGRFTPSERAPNNHWIGSWVDPRVTLDDVEKRKFFTLRGLKPRPLGRPARSQSLYRLSYPGSSLHCTDRNMMSGAEFRIHRTSATVVKIIREEHIHSHTHILTCR
jgi:hypothetical protein